MKNEFNKTVAGLLVIVGVVLLTYSYGATQHTSQIKHDQRIASAVAPTPAPTTSNNVRVATPAAPPKVVAVITPKPWIKPSIGEHATVSPSVRPKVAGAATQLPSSGSPLASIFALGAMSVMAALYLRSRRNA